MDWQTTGTGTEWGELRLSGRGEAWRLRVVLTRIDPVQFRPELVSAIRPGRSTGAWSIDSVPPGAVLGVNAGQFAGGTPWGWVVLDGREIRQPGHGPLSMAVVAERDTPLRIVPYESIQAVRSRGRVQEAFQSYPALLLGDGVVPHQLHAAGRGVDVSHRDSRVAIGELHDGRLLIAVTRFEGLGGVLSVLPFGPTTPEMAAIMGALGAHTAVMLDGGLSGQLTLRSDDGEARSWRGLRRVPLGLLLWPREPDGARAH